MGKGSFNNCVDKKRGGGGSVENLKRVSHDSIFVHLRGVGVNVGPQSC